MCLAINSKLVKKHAQASEPFISRVEFIWDFSKIAGNSTDTAAINPRFADVPFL